MVATSTASDIINILFDMRIQRNVNLNERFFCIDGCRSPPRYAGVTIRDWHVECSLFAIAHIKYLLLGDYYLIKYINWITGDELCDEALLRICIHSDESHCVFIEENNTHFNRAVCVAMCVKKIARER